MDGVLSRRELMGRAAGMAGAALLVSGGSTSGEAASVSAAARARFMARAMEMRQLAVARGDQPFGAVIVRDGQIVGEGASAVLTAPDPTAHGEVQAIRDAARRLGTAQLTGCDLYTTFRPCPMCEAAAYWAGIARIFHGDAITDAGAPRAGRC
jgi:tRNA(Arg) A34 adenosine deaminase TadA